MNAPTRASPGPDGYRSGGEQLPSREHGPRWKPDSQWNVATEVGVSQGTLVEARQHLGAVKRYPELGAADVSRSEALRLWKAWEALTPTTLDR
jgi:hypothetical protein